MLPDCPVGTVVRLNAGGLGHQRKLTQHGGEGIAFSGSSLTAEEAGGRFEWLGTDGGRNARVRSAVSGREGMIARDMLKRG